MIKDKTYIIVISSLIFGGMLYLLSILNLNPSAEAQTVIELPCPAGQAPWQSLTTRNPNTGGIRQYGCVDSSGNLTFIGAGVPAGSNTQVQFNNNGAFGADARMTYTSGVLTIGQLASLQGTLVLVTGGGTTASINGFGQNGYINFVSPVQFPSVTFASIGAVPGQGGTKFCNDCTTAATCASGGSGHLAVSNGTNWTCQ